MRLELSSYVEGDLDGIADFIAQDNPRRALTFIQDIRAKFHDILRNPMIYQLRPDIGEKARMVNRESIDFAMHRLNHRPRKCLGFKTPHEVFMNQLHYRHYAVALQT